jgi:hypothetical protein
VTLRCNQQFARRPWADSSTLYWTFRRRYRSTADLSQGWGHNSQWRTSFRRDFATPAEFIYNAGGIDPLDGLRAPEHFPPEVPLPPRLERQLLVNRCLLEAPPQGADPYPYDWTLREPAE